MSTLIEKAAIEVASAKSGETSDRSIGRILLEAGLITTEGAERALRLHKQEGILFGEACVRLGLVKTEDIQEALSSQFDYPYLRIDQGKVDRSLVAAYHPFSRQVEALRALRTQLLLRWFTPERRTLTVVSCDRADGRSFLVANLAIVFSQLGEKTLVIDADLRNPRQNAMFNLDNHVGLSTVLGGRTSRGAVQQVSPFVNLSVCCSGPKPPNPVELLSRSEFQRFVSETACDYDVVLIDTSAASLGSDAQAVSVRAAGAMVIVREGRTRARRAEAMTRALTGSGVEIAGGVLSRH